MRTWTRAVAGAAATLALLPGAMVGTSSATEGWQAPRGEQIMAGPSRPGVSAWGLAWNSVSGEFVVGDYVANQLRRYSRDGAYLGDFTNPKGSTQGVPSGIAVDPRDGAVYVAVTGDGRTSKAIRKYDSAGRFLFDFNTSGSTTWLAVDDEGDLWVPEAFGGQRVSEWRLAPGSKTPTLVRSMGTAGTGAGQLGRLTGIDVDDKGRAYVADPGNGTVHVFTQDGRQLADIGDRRLFKGDMRGVIVDDAADRLYVANSHVGTIEVFSLSDTGVDDGVTATRVATWSRLGEGPDEFVDGARQLALTPDGRLWAADYGSRRVLEFDSTSGAVLTRFPSPLQPADPAGLAGARGIAVDEATGDVVVSDSWNQRVLRFGPDGALLDSHGRRGSFTPDGMNYPRSVAIDPATRDVWVANYEGDPGLVVYDAGFDTVRRQIATPRFVNDMEIVDGKAYLLVRRSPAHLLVLDVATGDQLMRAEVSSADIKATVGTKTLRGIAVDPATGTFWITSDTHGQAYVMRLQVDAKNPLKGTLVREQTMTMAKRGWGATIVGDAVHVADAEGNRILVFDRTTYAKLGEYGAGTTGFGLGEVRGPSGLTSDAAGRIYTVEERNGRVHVFSPLPGPAAELTKPTVAWTRPASATGTPLVITGTAADDSGVATVELQVQDSVTKLFWNQRAGSWQTTAVWSPAVVWGPQTARTWRFTLVRATAGSSYTVKARATDVHRNLVARPIAYTFNPQG